MMRRELISLLVVALLFLPPQEARASLEFTAAGTTGVNCGSDSTLDGWTAFTYMVWMYQTARASGGTRQVINKGGWSGGNQRQASFAMAPSGGTDRIQLYVDRTTTDSQAQSQDNATTLNTWQFIAATWDGTDGPRIFIGNLATPVAELGSYAIRTVGSGNRGNDSADNLYIAASGGGANSVGARIAFVAIYNRRLTVEELRVHQFRPFPAPGCVLFLELGWAGTGTQADLSGNGNNGTVTGASVADHVPLARWP